eukprot:scaffold820_cov104-Isochrysis_galbana.AAC.1
MRAHGRARQTSQQGCERPFAISSRPGVAPPTFCRRRGTPENKTSLGAFKRAVVFSCPRTAGREARRGMLDTPRASSSPASSTAKGGESVEYADRFIPARRGINLQEGFALLPDSPPRPREPGSSSASGGNAGDAPGREDLDTYSMLLRSELLGDEPASHSGAFRRGEGPDLMSPSANTNLFRYRVSPSPRDGSLPFSLSPMSAASQRATSSSRRTPRKIPTAPYKVLDAPALQDDFYLNLVDWSSSNLLAVGLGAHPPDPSTHTSAVDVRMCVRPACATPPLPRASPSGLELSVPGRGRCSAPPPTHPLPLPPPTHHLPLPLPVPRHTPPGSCVYLWSACTSKVTKLCDLGADETVTSVSWAQRGSHLAIGSSTGEVQIWDAVKNAPTRIMTGHQSRVGSLAWTGHTLSSGSRDRQICMRDVRSPWPFTSQLVGHKQEVCGLKWSFDGMQLASGGNDNKLFIWSAGHSTIPAVRFTQHTAAVKALAWSPHQHGLIASGGGTADRCIRFWNTQTASALSSVDTGSQ